VSIRAEIFTAIANRLETVKSVNGYSTNVNKVYFDEIPMGIQLQPHQLPAIFLLDRQDPLDTEHKQLVGRWDIDMQLWNVRVGDVAMMQFVRDVYKAIYANSSTAQREDEFRSLHPQIVEVKPLWIRGDLNMIKSNRITELSFSIHYRTRLHNM
jgi:hypothetical protein